MSPTALVNDCSQARPRQDLLQRVGLLGFSSENPVITARRAGRYLVQNETLPAGHTGSNTDRVCFIISRIRTDNDCFTPFLPAGPRLERGKVSQIEGVPGSYLIANNDCLVHAGPPCVAKRPRNLLNGGSLHT